MSLSPKSNSWLSATIAGWCWFAVLVTLLIGTCGPTRCAEFPTSDPAGPVCRVHNRQQGTSSIGSGTLIDKAPDGQQGLVLTCAHLFAEGVGEIVVEFPGAKLHGAKLVAIDRQADLAALAISNPTPAATSVELTIEEQGVVRACGFGPQGEFRCVEGAVVGEANDAGQLSILIGEAVRSGDSGGGVFDRRGRLVAVVWGESQGVTYASTGPPLRRFLDRVLGHRTAVMVACPGGSCPRPLPGGAVGNNTLRPTIGDRPPRISQDENRWAEISQRVAQLEATKQDRGDYLTRDDLQEYVPRTEANRFAEADAVDRLEQVGEERHATLQKRLGQLAAVGGKVAGAAALGTLGISGPVGWGILTGTTVGGLLLGRFIQRSGVGGRRRRRFFTESNQ